MTNIDNGFDLKAFTRFYHKSIKDIQDNLIESI